MSIKTNDLKTLTEKRKKRDAVLTALIQAQSGLMEARNTLLEQCCPTDGIAAIINGNFGFYKDAEVFVRESLSRVSALRSDLEFEIASIVADMGRATDQ